MSARSCALAEPADTVDLERKGSAVLLRQVITRLVMGVALLCGSFAWSGWVFLHSVGDPHRAERIANSILDSPSARAEIASPIADQIVQNFALPASNKTAIADAVAE